MKKPHSARAKKIRKYFWISFIIILMACPYPYEPGGTFTLLAQSKIELHAQVAGEVTAVMVRENDSVTAGQVQATIDTWEHQKNYNVHLANLEKEKAQLRLLDQGARKEEIEKARQETETLETELLYARKDKNRLDVLYKEGVVPLEEFEEGARKADIVAQRLEVAKDNLQIVSSGPRPEERNIQINIVKDLQTRVDYYKEALKRTRLLAPINGRVITPDIEMKRGKILKEGDLFAVYEDSRTIRAEIMFPEGEINEIKIGARVKIRTKTFPTRFFYGKVSLIAPTAIETKFGKRIRVITELPNQECELKPEMTGYAKIASEGYKPVILAFSRWLVRFFFLEVWSWFP